MTRKLVLFRVDGTKGEDNDLRKLILFATYLGVLFFAAMFSVGQGVLGMLELVRLVFEGHFSFAAAFNDFLLFVVFGYQFVARKPIAFRGGMNCVLGGVF
jgi:hypothetical protein